MLFALFALLDETFDKVKGYYLDEGNSLFEILFGITAEEVSILVGGWTIFIKRWRNRLIMPSGRWRRIGWG